MSLKYIAITCSTSGKEIQRVKWCYFSVPTQTRLLVTKHQKPGGKSMIINRHAVLTVILITVLSGIGLARVAAAASAEEIDTKVNGALAEFRKEVPGGTEFLNKASGVLVFPDVIKAGLVVGGEYGAGALRIGGKTVQHYNIASASFGFQIGAQQYAIVMVFLNDEALQKFRDSKGWEAGVDGSVAIAQWGAGEDINTQNFKDPIVGFVFSNKGLMAGISIEGSKITKIEK